MEMLFVFLLAGAVGGIVVGLMGGGIGPIVVPLLMMTLPMMGVDHSLAAHLAVGTSLAIVVVTTCSSVFSHHKNRSINWVLFRKLLWGSVVGAIVGAIFSILVSGSLLKIFFGCFLIYLAVEMYRVKDHNGSGAMLPPALKLVCMSIVLAAISTMLGVCYGLLLIPFLKKYNLVMLEAVATASVCSIVVSVIGLIPSLFIVFTPTLLPKYSLGYVYLPAFLGIGIASVIFAPLGVYLARRLSEKSVKNIFIAGSTLIGLKMIF